MSSYSQRALGKLQQGRDLLKRVYTSGPTKVQRLLGSASARLTDNPFIGLCGVNDQLPLDAAQMILGYSQGLFPLDFGDKLRWHCPDPRFVLFLDELRLSPNMRRDIRKSKFTHSFDREPQAILDGCGERRSTTWLTPRLKKVYLELFDMGVMHTIETWRDGELVGGSFGVAVGRVFTGETMFHRVPEAGKSSFCHLAAYLREQGFVCIDAQSPSDHMMRFGAKEMPFSEYRKTLAAGLARAGRFGEVPADPVSQLMLRADAPASSITPKSNAPKSNGAARTALAR
jgi:leucyl/phenylalanyl-tRNA--protein transferase